MLLIVSVLSHSTGGPTGGGGPADPGVRPGQPDLPQEVPCPGGGEHAGEPKHLDN